MRNYLYLYVILHFRWRDEAKSLTVKFQGKSKELRGKINFLQKENNELNRELLTCKQQLAQHAIEDIQKSVFTVFM